MENLKPQEILAQFETVNVAAPMVRYSKLPFRQLVANYETHITYTPMILAPEFSRSATARALDFTTNSIERGTFDMVERGRKTSRRVRGSLIMQLASNDPVHLAEAAELASPYVDGVDLNCGCPQRWAFSEGIGSALLRKPELVHDMVRTTKQRLGWEFPVSVKIRVDNDLSLTETLVSRIIAAGADFITVHGRTRFIPSTQPVDLEAIDFAVSCTKGQLPVVGNGDIFTVKDAETMREKSHVHGVMSARGLLANPALFAGYDSTPRECVKQFIDIATSTSLSFPLFHRHLSYMLEGSLPRRRDRTFFNSLTSHAGVIDFVDSLMPETVSL